MSATSRNLQAVRPHYVTTVLGNGEICPISERIGRRRVRSIDARSAEGRRLLRSGAVTVRVRDGRRFSGMPVVEIFDRLAEDLRREAAEPEADPRAVAALESLRAEMAERRRSYS